MFVASMIGATKRGISMETVKMSLDKNHTKYIDGYIKKTKNKKLYKEYINFG